MSRNVALHAVLFLTSSYLVWGLAQTSKRIDFGCGRSWVVIQTLNHFFGV